MASLRRIRRQSCSGKVKHRSAGAAWIAARKTGDGVRPYRCAFCGSWHVGHPHHRRKLDRTNYRYAEAGLFA